MNITNSQLAIIIATAILAARADRESFTVEEVPASDPHACYEGVKLYHRDDSSRCADLYLCDDDAKSPTWMVDCFDATTGDVNPLPFTAESFAAALKFLQEGGVA
jgi:hypothetical protein